MATGMLELAHAGELDAADPLAGYRDRFALDDPSLIYLNGNSLGAPPRLGLLATMRSNDLNWGFPYDVPAFCFLQLCLARELGWRCGEYSKQSLAQCRSRA